MKKSTMLAIGIFIFVAVALWIFCKKKTPVYVKPPLPPIGEITIPEGRLYVSDQPFVEVEKQAPLPRVVVK